MYLFPNNLVCQVTHMDNLTTQNSRSKARLGDKSKLCVWRKLFGASVSYRHMSDLRFGR